MTTRTFIFCDCCNPKHIRNTGDGQLNGDNPDQQYAWFEGYAFQASKLGWVSTEDGRNLCPRCAISHNKPKKNN